MINAVPNLKPHNPNNIPVLGNCLRILRFYRFFLVILSLQVILITLTLFDNQLIPTHLSLKLNNFANLVQHNQYENARTELNEILKFCTL